MGFRCPYCNQDFGRDKQKFDQHLHDNPKCHAEAWAYTDFAMHFLDKRKRGREVLSEPETSRHYDHISPDHQWQKVNIVTNDDGSDTIICKRCGLKAKRYYGSLKFDMRYVRKIENCIDG